MAKYEFVQPKFTEGVLANAFAGRSSEEFYHYGLKSCKNMIPILSGPCVKRPGTNFIGEAKNSTATFHPFFKDKDNTYILEIGASTATFTLTCQTNDVPTITTATTAALFKGMGVSGPGIASGATIISVDSGTDFDISVVPGSDLGPNTLTFSTYSYLRIWSLNQLLNNKSLILSDTTPTPSGAWQASQSHTNVSQTSTSGSGTGAEFSIATDGSGNPTVTVTTIGSGYLASDTLVLTDPHVGTTNTATVTVSSTPSTFEITMPWTAAEVPTLNTTQSGDYIFVCCPTKSPRRIIRTVDLTDTGTDVCSDGSKWVHDEFIMEDGPWMDVNIFKEDDATEQYSIKLDTEPSTSVTVQKRILGNVEFDITTNSIILMNHGLQAGMQVTLADQGASGTCSSVDDSEGVHFNHAGHSLKEDDVIQIQATTTFPGNIEANTNYFVIDVTENGSAIGFKLGLTKGGDAIEYSSAGSGTITYTSSWGNLVNDTTNEVSTLNGTKTVYVVATTSGAFKISDTDSGTPYEMNLRTAATSPNANVLLSRPRYKVGTTVSFKQYLAGTETTNTNRLITSTDVGRQIRINPLSRPLESLSSIRWTWGIIKEVTGATTFTVKLETEICNTREDSVSTPVTKGTSEFRLGAFSDTLGWPQVPQIYQQRMVFAASNTQPSTIWLSRTADFYSFAPTVIQDQSQASSISDGIATEVITNASALNFTLDSDTLDQIKWLAESKKLTMGTSAGIYMLYGSETNLTVTPFRFTINKESTFSATDTAPIIVSNAVIYPQIGGKDVQALLFEGESQQWNSSKISLKGYDIIKSSQIKKMVWQERPLNIIWIMMDDGRLLSLSYDRQAQFAAWAEHIIGGTDVKVTDIEMIPTASHDQIWLKIERTINGSTKYYVETLARFPMENALDREAYVFSDSALTISIAGKAFTVTDSSGLLVTSVAHGLVDTQIIQVSNSGGTLPTTLIVGTDYYVKYVNADTFRLALSSGGTSIAYNAGSGGINNWKTKEVRGYTHLIAETVQIYYGGMQHASKVVASNGTVTLEHFQATDTVIGLSYEGELETLEPSAPDNQYSFSKRLLNLQLIIEESLGIEVSYNDLSEEILFRSMLNQMGVKIDLFTGKKDLSLSGIGWESHNLKIISNGPFPMQINALVIEAETGGT